MLEALAEFDNSPPQQRPQVRLNRLALLAAAALLGLVAVYLLTR
jgi:hypothetical protein